MEIAAREGQKVDVTRCKQRSRAALPRTR